MWRVEPSATCSSPPRCAPRAVHERLRPAHPPRTATSHARRARRRAHVRGHSPRDDDWFAGVAPSAGGRSVSLADSRLEPLWTDLAADDRLLLLHPGETPDVRLHEFYLANLSATRPRRASPRSQLVFGEILARHPGLRVLLVRCGGVVPAVAGCWQRGADTSRPGVSAEIEPPANAVRRFHVDCLAHDPAVVDPVVSVFGEDKMVLGSDWPFPMGTPDPTTLVAHRGEAFVHRAPWTTRGRCCPVESCAGRPPRPSPTTGRRKGERVVITPDWRSSPSGVA